MGTLLNRGGTSGGARRVHLRVYKHSYWLTHFFTKGAISRGVFCIFVVCGGRWGVELDLAFLS